MVEDEAAENSRASSSLDPMTVSKQTWIMLHHDCAENVLATLCRGKTSVDASVFKRSYQNQNLLLIKKQILISDQGITGCVYTLQVTVFCP